MTLIRILTRACVREYVSLIMKEPEDVVIGGKENSERAVGGYCLLYMTTSHGCTMEYACCS